MSTPIDGIISAGAAIVSLVEGWVKSAREGNEAARAHAATRLRQLAGTIALLDEAEKQDADAAVREAVARALVDTPVLGTAIPALAGDAARPAVVLPPRDDP